VTSWNDDRGFGFVAAEPSGEQVFVRISAFVGRDRRPMVGDHVTFATRIDEQRRPQAIKVKWVGGAMPLRSMFGLRLALTLSALGFLGLLAVLYGVGRIAFELCALYWIVSVVTFVAYGLDKSAARAGCWRTAESTLQGLALIGGWPGALLAQQWLRHKSRKPRFLVLFWWLAWLNVAVLLSLFQQEDPWREFLGERFSLGLNAGLG